MLSRHTYAFFVGALCGHGERIWLNRFSEFPTSSTLEVVGFTTVNKDDMTEMSMVGPVTMNVDSSSLPESLHVAIVPHAELEKLHSESSFCCSENMVKESRCKKVGDVVLQSSYAFPVATDSLQNGFAGMLFKTRDVGLHYVTLVNCGSKDGKGIRFSSGELSIVGKKGYLPAEEAEKLTCIYSCLRVMLLRLFCGVSGAVDGQMFSSRYIITFLWRCWLVFWKPYVGMHRSTIGILLVIDGGQ